MRYVSKPQTVEAIQWTGDNINEITKFLMPARAHANAPVILANYQSQTNKLSILAGKDGAQGFVPVPVGHYIVHNPRDYTDLWPVDPDYFENKYDKVVHYADEE